MKPCEKQQQAEKLLERIEEYSRILGFMESALMRRDHLPDLVIARQVWWYYLRKNGLKVTYIGRVYGYTHATVIHGIGHAAGLIEIGDAYAIECLNATKEIQKRSKVL